MRTLPFSLILLSLAFASPLLSYDRDRDRGNDNLLYDRQQRDWDQEAHERPQDYNHTYFYDSNQDWNHRGQYYVPYDYNRPGLPYYYNPYQYNYDYYEDDYGN